ncbi:hypothetical protein BCT30_04580 [Enterovibrio norvegicus]|nr:hypothetical protein BCU47_10770 [Enterovibrio norvegicus]PMI34870.1 hypothetical protein BCU46_02900 [Enterovibrio norvegicus]PMN45077.1 hypothetical protein BCT30_04580 [Enterovibrio norvegicus]
MRAGSYNFRASFILGVMNKLKTKGLEIVIYEPVYKEKTLFNSKVELNLKCSKKWSILSSQTGQMKRG